MNTVDYVVMAILLIAMGLGWHRGFLKTVLRPICWVLCIYLGYAYYLRTQSLVVSLVISLIGPLVVQFILTAFVEIIQKAGKKDGKKNAISIFDRGLGMCVSGLWMTFLISAAFFMVGMVPFKIPGFEPFRRSIVDSKSYGAFNRVASKQFPRLAKTNEPAAIDFTDPEAVEKFDIEQIQNSKEFKDLMSHPQVEALFQDTAFQDRVRSGQVFGIMEDARVKEILQDPQVMKDFFAFYNRLIQMAPAAGTGSVDSMLMGQ